MKRGKQPRRGQPNTGQRGLPSRSAEPAAAALSSLFDLTGRVALVTGGAGHLGGAIAAALAEAGARVVVSSRDRARAAKAAAALPGPAKHLAVALDHMDPRSIELGF